MTYAGSIKKYLSHPVPIAPLAMFRVLFGFMMLVSIARFVLRGWVYDFYVAPQYYFPYFGFEWVRPFGEIGMYLLFALMAVCSVLIMLGLFYRYAAILFFLAFTYTELIDKTYYLNHYYFISLMSLLMVFLPAHRCFSLDVLRKPEIGRTEIPRWTVGSVRFQLALVYIFAGIAKLNYAWLFEAMPLKIWLQGQTDLPLIGPLFDLPWVPFVFSWFGAIYDLFIVFFLIYRPTRLWAYAAVIAFHVMTGMLFNIGMFPYIMILATLVFFSAEFHEKLMNRIATLWGGRRRLIRQGRLVFSDSKRNLALGCMGFFFALQLLIVMRSVFYPGDLFWTEQGYRFSWRVMLVEKAGTAFFYVTDPESGGSIEIDNSDFLTKTQEKMMSYQPDMILQYAHILRDHYRNKPVFTGRDTVRIEDPAIFAKVYVRMNNTGSRLFIDPEVNLAGETESFARKDWILHYED